VTTVTHTPLAEAEHSQVLIAGGGPAGMVLAYRLAKQGITVRVLEAATHCMEDMRASTFHPPTLGMMDALGLLPALEAQGLKAPVFQYSNRATGSNFALDAGEIADVTPYPYRLQCEQFKLTRLIAGLLAEMPNATVEFSRRIIHFEQDADGVTAHGEGPIDIKPYRADYLVAADGASSTVRKWLGVQFDGFTYAESFLTLSTAYPIERHLPWLADVNYVADPPEWCVLLRVPGLWRVLVPQTATTADEDIRSDARKDAVFAHLLGPDAPIVETHHRTVYRVHQRVAQTFRVGRVALIGDSAHLNNPLGGFGMNSGVHDAWNLADKLERVLLGGEDAAPLLDLYDRQRRGVTHGFVQKQTIANKGALGSAFADREAQLSALMKDTDARRAYLMNQLMLNTPALEAAIT
jgi:3-(3-hydroxy-phenyl)propionate hydroxylase